MQLHISGLQPFVGGGFAVHTTLDVEHRRKGKEMGFTKHVRTAAVAVVVVASITWGAPPAQAKTLGKVIFVGNTSLACPGLGYIGAPLGTVDMSPNNCPFVTVSTLLCGDAIENSLKSTKPPVVGGLNCFVGLVGTITGYCELFFAKGTGIIVDSTGHFIVVSTFAIMYNGGQGLFTGVVSKPQTGQKGMINGPIRLIDPTPVSTPTGGSCLAKTATIFPTGASLTLSLL